MKQISKGFFMFIPLFFFGMSLTAQVETARNGVPTFVKFAANEKPLMRNAQATLKQKLNFPRTTELKLLSQKKDKLGFIHHKYQQYYKGIKVEFGTYAIHEKNNRIQVMNGDYYPISTLRIVPRRSEAQALAAAKRHIRAEKYMWESKSNEEFARLNEPRGTFFPKGELVIVKGFNTKDKNMSLAYKFDIYAEKPLSRDHVYVDAHTGQVVFKNAIIKHCFHHESDHNHNHSTEASSRSSNHKDYVTIAKEKAHETVFPFVALGSADTRYSGTRNIETGSTSGGYRLRDSSRGGGINTFDCNTGTSYNSAVDFVDNNNNWTAGEWNNAAKDNAGIDAHWGAEQTYDYFLSQHNRNSYNGNGAAINSYVHYDRNYDNAFWDGSRMTYGDGSTFDALTSLDVSAHEIGHGVCSFTADLVYSYESGALNEAFSDIWAACVENFAAPEKEEWLVGEDIGQSYGPLRDMANPKSKGHPDTYQGTNWNFGSSDNGGVHTNSGVLNHCFHILTMGKSGTNDNGDSYSVNGIGFEKAAAIFYRAESVYLSSNSQYADARTACIASAEDIYGAYSNEVCSTTNSFYAVGVGAEISCAAPACDDGLQNGNETGVDCGGSCPNACPTCDDNTQNGDEEGVDCGGSNCAPCPCVNSEINVSIKLDNYPQETSWVLSLNGSTIASGGTYNNQPDGSTVTLSQCVDDGCYEFTISDSYGDGICCGYGNGSYSVTDADGKVLAAGGSFGSSESTSFCLTSTPPVQGCTNPNAHNYDSSATQDDGSCETCSDGILNGDEEQVDCGGGLCATCPPDPIPGCTDSNAHNYDSSATQDDGSCETCSDGVLNGDEEQVDCGGGLCAACPPDPIPGCTDSNAHNYDSNATQDDGSCETCSDGILNGDEEQIDCGGGLCAACPPDPIPGCTDANAHNYDSNATQDDGSCETCSDGIVNGDETGVDCGGSLCAACPVPGCTDASAHNYDSAATQDDGTCETCDDGILNGDEIEIDCGGSLCSPCSNPGECTDVTINSNDFESTWGIWNDGGSDCRISTWDSSYANSGIRCVRLRDNSSTSNMTSDPLNLTSFEEITISYSMYAVSMENNEDYFVEVNTGNGWVVVGNYARGVHFNNNTRYFDDIVVSGPFSSSTTIRFRCDASANGDRVYFDDVVLTGCQTTAAFASSETRENESVKTSVDLSVESSLAIYPNPATDLLNVDYVVSQENSKISLYNQLGQVVKSKVVLPSENTIQLNINDLETGSYFIMIQNNQETLIEQFVKF